MPTQNAPLLLPHRAHFDFRARPNARVMESLAHAGRIYAGVQNGVWQYDEYYWSERRGAWGGVLPFPATQAVGALHIEGAARETLRLDTVTGLDCEPVDRVPSGAPFFVVGTPLYGVDLNPRPSRLGWSVARLYSCASGALVAERANGAAFDLVADGSYLLWARIVGGDAIQTHFGLARSADGEWSALRVVVGAGAWSIGFGICPSPGPALYAKADDGLEAVVTEENQAAYHLVFDPLARAVSASCELEQPLRTSDGQFIAPAGALLIGGLRASADGPQSALWLLRGDGTARLLALQTRFTSGVCECAKTNHHCSDLVQNPDGTLFFLTECALFRYDEGALSIREALPGYPDSSHGHPGGNCLRFLGANEEMIHWTEDLTSRDKGDTLFYNRIVRRVGGRDALGPSTLWHGTNCAEMFLGRLMAVRGQRGSGGDEGTLYLDWVSGGQWQNFSGLARPMKTHFWQRLRALGNHLFVWGYAPAENSASIYAPAHAPVDAPVDAIGAPTIPTKGANLDARRGDALNLDDDAIEASRPRADDKPLCAVADGLTLREAAFPYFIRRATVCNAGESGGANARLFTVARDERDGIGPASRVVEITGSKTHICAFWDDDAKGFVLSRAAFEALGGNAAQLPSYHVWVPQRGRDGGGLWRAVDERPANELYLETQSDATSITFHAMPQGELPYDPAQWGKLCFDILADGSVEGPFIEPTPTNAQEALDAMPPGTKFRVIERPVPGEGAPLTAFQINDGSRGKRLGDERDLFPCLYYRSDSDAPKNDLTTYTYLAHYGRLIVPFQVRRNLDVVVLVAPQNQPVESDEWPQPMRRA